jgi:voltage-gated potassium channel Kch
VASDPGESPQLPGFQARVERQFVRKPPTPVRAAGVIAGVSLAVSLLAGLVAHWIDDSIPTVWLGVYWAVQTVTTVGYGDVTPQGTKGQALSVGLMLIGTAFVAVVTAAVTSIFIERAQTIRDIEAAAEDPVPAELAEIRATLARIEARLQ